MPEPHSETGEQQGEFRPSTPHLEPNLGGTTEQLEKGGRYSPARPFDNEVGQVAADLRGYHPVRPSDAWTETPKGHYVLGKTEEERISDVDRITEDVADYNAMIERLAGKKGRSAMEKIAVDSAIAVLQADRDALGLAAAQDNLEIATNAVEANLHRAEHHFRDNEEAYKNQAVNEYRARQRSYPDTYPEPLDYPGYTDQVDPSTPEAPEQQ